MSPALTPQPYPEDHPLTITARYYEAALTYMRGKGHATERVEDYFQGRYLVECPHSGCYATLMVLQYEGQVLHHGKGAELRCPVRTLEENQGQPQGVPELWRRQQEGAERFMEEIGRVLGGIKTRVG